MKHTAGPWIIVCTVDKNIVGYWSALDNRIRTKTIEMYTDYSEVERELERASTQLPVQFNDVIIPVAIEIIIKIEPHQYIKSANDHLGIAVKHWPHKPERISAIKNAIKQNTLKP